MDVRIEQRVNIKFCVKLNKTATETLQLLRDAYGDEALSRARVFGWHRRFVLGRVSVEDDTGSGRPSSSRNEDNVVRIRDMIREDRTLTVRMLADALRINKLTCHQILREDLGKRKLNARLVPHALTQDQKEVRASICAELLQEVLNDATFVNSIIAEDESWCFQYDPQTKRQSAKWRSTGTPPSKKVRRQPSTTKTMIMVFFDTRGIVHHELVPQGQTVNQEVYISVLRRMREALGRRRPDLWASGQWTLLHDNARPHTALSVSRFLTKHNVTVLPHPPYSPDLSPCDFFLFPRLKKG